MYKSKFECLFFLFFFGAFEVISWKQSKKQECFAFCVLKKLGGPMIIAIEINKGIDALFFLTICTSFFLIRIHVNSLHYLPSMQTINRDSETL